MPVPADGLIVHQAAFEIDVELEDELIDLLVLNKGWFYFAHQLQSMVGGEIDRDFRATDVLFQEKGAVDPLESHCLCELWV